MKITDSTIYQVKGRGWPKYPWIWVEITTDTGITGIGEAAPINGVVEAIHHLGQKLQGQNPFNIEKIFEESFRSGTFLPAISGIEIALWDIIGQQLQVPIYNLLGGQCHDQLRVYLDGFFRGADYNPEDYAEKAKHAVNQGFMAIKADIDPPHIPTMHRINRELDSADLLLTVDIIQAVRDAIGKEIDFAIDTHGSFNLPAILKLAKMIESYNLLWIEDPVTRIRANMKTLAYITSTINTPVCVGENLFTRFEFRELFEQSAADIIMPDICYTGGILEMKKIAALADTYHVPFCPHNYLGPIATMASIQVCACVPNFSILEFQGGEVPWRDRVLSDPIPLEKGFIKLPTKPGIGVTLNKDELEPFLVQ